MNSEQLKLETVKVIIDFCDKTGVLSPSEWKNKTAKERMEIFNGILDLAKTTSSFVLAQEINDLTIELDNH